MITVFMLQGNMPNRNNPEKVVYFCRWLKNQIDYLNGYYYHLK